MVLTEGLGKAYVSLVGNKTQIITSLGIYQMATGICNFFRFFDWRVIWDLY